MLLNRLCPGLWKPSTKNINQALKKMNKTKQSKSNKLKQTEQMISDKLIQIIQDRLFAGKRVRRTLPLDGRLHIDRTLPFLVVYRQPVRNVDEGTDQLVKGEASYLIASRSQKLRPSLTKLLRTIVQVLAGKCHGFLIIEIWTKERRTDVTDFNPGIIRPEFRIITSAQRPPTRTIEVFEDALKRIKLNKFRASVKVVYDKNRSPQGVKPLLSSTEVRKLNCYVIGLEIEPVYRHPETNDIFPLVLRKFHLQLTKALRQAVYEFSKNQTRFHPDNYLALGRQAVVNAVWEVDNKLAEISSKFDFLLLSTPVNTESAWTKFKKDSFEKSPAFYYRPRAIDPSVLKFKLYEIPIERVEGPILALLFREKRKEIDRQLTMLEDRETKSFLYGSLQLYGAVNDELLQLAENILKKIPPHSRNIEKNGYLNANEFAKFANREIEFYRKLNPVISASVQIRDDMTGLMVSRGNLLIGHKLKIPISRREALLQHEIGTHMLTYFNGLMQPLKQLYCGLPDYDELQEGLAVLAEYLVGGLNNSRLRLLAGRVVAGHNIINGASFIETFRILNKDHGFTQRNSFMITTRIYRGGGMLKDIIYLRGLVKLLDYLKNGGELDPLFIGKIGVEHIPIIKELQLRKVLHPTPLYPRYLKDDQTAFRLRKIKTGISIINLIER